MPNDRALDLRGLWVPIITPLTSDDEVDRAALDRLVRRLLADGCAGLVALGTTGEPATLTEDEKISVIETCAQACADADRGLIVGAGSNSTRASVDEVGRVESRVHPTAVLVVVPYYTRPAEGAIVEHFRTIATESTAPVVIYNVPYRTGRSLGADAILELANEPGIVGMKQAVGGLDHDTLEILRRRPEGFSLLAGDDAYIVPTILMGGAGAIAAAAHVCTRTFVEMVDAASAGDVATAAAIAHSLLPVVDAGFAEPNPAVWKSALHAGGEIGSPNLRRPMTEASPGAAVALRDAIGAVP